MMSSGIHSGKSTQVIKAESIDFLNIPPSQKQIIKDNMIWCNSQYDKYTDKK